MTHICVSTLNIIDSDNGLFPGRRQAIIRTNAGIFLIWNFSEMLIESHIFYEKKTHLKILPGKWRPFCPGLDVLNAFHLIIGEFCDIFFRSLWDVNTVSDFTIGCYSNVVGVADQHICDNSKTPCRLCQSKGYTCGGIQLKIVLNGRGYSNIQISCLRYIRAWMCNYISVEQWDMITLPFPKSNSGFGE